MNFPIWEVPYLGGGLFIGIVAVLYVFISHFAAGGGLFLVLTERKAYRENNPAMLEYVKKHLEIIPKRAGHSTIRKTVAIYTIAGHAESIKNLSIIRKLKIESLR